MNDKIILYLLGAFIAYKLFFSKEGFALSTLTTSPTAGKYYLRATYNGQPVSELQAAQNGGKSCPARPQYSYILPNDAVCQVGTSAPVLASSVSDIVDGNYTLDNSTVYRL
jgi:hypothetical protein